MKIFYKLILLLIVLGVSGCALVTRFEVYRLVPNSNTHIALKYDEIIVTAYLDPVEKKSHLFH